ncbi:isoaspartyl peptidase/L-asparaginase [Myxococcota bacterium]|nr:isoaspartyl peptidase/L-asparaginase [Myxococcota bacterium]
MWSIIVHGGAGAIRDGLSEKHQAGCRRAAEAGADVLAHGGSSLDAACAAVRVLEDDPTYNAGIGGALDERGVVALDAAVMRGSDLAYGAVGAVTGVLRAVDLARAVLVDGRHSLVVGRGALELARRFGIPTIDPELLVTEHARSEWTKRMAELANGGPQITDWMPADEPETDPTTDAAIEPESEGREGTGPFKTGDTVGAVARDAHGVISAATSTGGLTARYTGRVGDSPIAGAGTYARDDLGGVSATGHGETMMKTVLAYQTLIAIAAARGDDPTDVIRRELDRATARAGGKGGIIAVLPDGRVAWARNTRHMGVAWVRAGEPVGSDF